MKKDEYKTIEKELHLVVEQASYAHVKDKQHETVDSDMRVKIGADHHLDITGKQAIKVGGSHSLHVTGAVTEQFDQGHSEQVSMGYYLKALNVVIESSVGVTLQCGGNYVTVDPVGVTIMATWWSSMALNDRSGPGSQALSGQAGSLGAHRARRGARCGQRSRRDGGLVEQITAEGKYGSAARSASFSASSEDPEGKEKALDRDQAGGRSKR